MKFTVETEQEADGRWIAEIIELPGVMKYGGDREEAVALRVVADRIEHGEHPIGTEEAFANQPDTQDLLWKFHTADDGAD